MSINATIPNTIDDVLKLYHKLSYDEKKANNWKWIEQIALSNEYIFSSNTSRLKLAEKDKINSDLAKGRGAKLLNSYNNTHNTDLISEGVERASNTMKYYDILTPIIKSMYGEAQKKNLNAIALDISKYNLNVRKKKRENLFKDYLRYNVVQKIQMESQREIMLKHKIDDIHKLKPEEQDQFNSEVAQLVKFKTPSDIENFMRNEYKSSSEKQLQSILEWLKREYDLKFLLDESFKNLIVYGREIIYSTIRHYKPYVELINPMFFDYSSNKNSLFIDDGYRFKYDKYIDYASVLSDYPIETKDFDKLKKLLITGDGGSNITRRSIIRGELPYNIQKEIQQRLATVQIGAEGNSSVFINPESAIYDSNSLYSFNESLYNILGEYVNNLDSIKVSNHVFLSNDKLYYVRRKDKRTGKLKGYWVWENYEDNKELDYDKHETWIKAYYQCDQIGIGENSIFVNKGRVPFQNRSINNPFDILSPYTGMEYSKMFNNSDPIAPLDFGKPYAYEVCVIKNKLEELDEKNMGKILGLPETFKPHTWSYGKYQAMMKIGGIAPIDTTKNAGLQTDNTLFKVLDLSNNPEIQANINRIEHAKQEATQAMSYSQAALGQSPASTTATVNQQNIIQHSYKTEDIYTLHSKFIERFLNNICNITRNSLRENEDLKTYLLDDLGIAELDLDEDVLHMAEIMVKVTNDSEDLDDLKAIKELLHPMVQSGLAGFSDVIKTRVAKNPSTVINIAEAAEEKARQRASEEAKQRQKELEFQRETQMKLEKLKQDREDMRLRMQLDSKELGYKLDSIKFQLANDTDEDKVPDSVEVANIKKETEKYKADLKYKADMEKIKMDEKRQKKEERKSKK